MVKKCNAKLVPKPVRKWVILWFGECRTLLLPRPHSLYPLSDNGGAKVFQIFPQTGGIFPHLMFFPQDGGKIHSKVCTVDKIYGSNKYLFLITPESIAIKPVLSSCEKKVYQREDMPAPYEKTYSHIIPYFFPGTLYSKFILFRHKMKRVCKTDFCLGNDYVRKTSF